MNDPTTESAVSVTLGSPVIFNGETFSDLTFREPEVGDLIRAEREADEIDGGQQAVIAATLAAMCGMPFAAFQRIKAKDLRVIMAATRDFLDGDGQPTSKAGETSPS